MPKTSFAREYAELRDARAHSTLCRLFYSRHVRDMLFIILAASLLLIGAGLLGFVVTVDDTFAKAVDASKGKLPHIPFWALFHHGPRARMFSSPLMYDAVISFLSFFGPSLVAYGAVVAWTYQIASARLGVVDLFACEIGSLCRVLTILDTTRQNAELFARGLPPGSEKDPTKPAQFSSEENYFPVFDNNTHDLQSLDAEVVINITAFYTYMKATRDLMRRTGAVTPLASDRAPSELGLPLPHGSWREALCNAIYMVFLALESGRHATMDLVEFQPDRAERIVTTLLSELPAYAFLLRQYNDPHDVRCQRLRLRATGYRKQINELIQSIEFHGAGRKTQSRHNSGWQQAGKSLSQLLEGYEAVRKAYAALPGSISL